MKILILLSAAVCLASCQCTKPITEENETIVKTDTIHVPNQINQSLIAENDSLKYVISERSEELQRIGIYKNQIDSLKTANNKLGKELLHNKLIITNANYYLNIANRNASQRKFLRGWMNRALSQ